MKNWAKENWFKLGLLIILFFLSWGIINFMQIAIDLMETVEEYVGGIDSPIPRPSLPSLY